VMGKAYYNGCSRPVKQDDSPNAKINYSLFYDMKRGAPSRVTEAVDRLTGTRHLYRRTGFDARPMEFRSDGGIGAGSGRLESQWCIHQDQDDVFLDIGNAAGLTCRLTLGEGGVWRGRWENFERMPVEVYPQPDPPSAVHGIDVVYTWVDGATSAPVLRALLDAGSTPVLPGAATHNRYRSIGELRFSLRSLHVYAPWVQRVFLVTNGDIPPWINLDCPKLRLVTHPEIFENASALPTFNSHAIELNLHRIPGIGPAFLYFNDDLFLGQPVRHEDFLSADDIQNIFFTDWDIPCTKTEQAHDRAYGFTLGLLDRAYGARPRRMLAHVPQLYRVDVLEEICRRWKVEVENTTGNRFRNGDDAVLRILYAYYLLESPVPRWAARKVILPQGRDYVFVPISTNHAHTRQGLSKAVQGRPKFLCLNDEIAGDGECSAGVFEDVCEFLSGQYPWPSPFEHQE
jgi:hypothetical protein